MKVVIIGAGIAGLSIGWRLAEAGAAVVVLDRAQPGRGATWAAAGMLAATAESADAPASEHAFAKASLALWPAFAERLEQASGVSLSYRADGTLMAARDAAEARVLVTRAAAADLLFIGANDAREMEPLLAPDVHGALWAPDDAQVDNRALGSALATAFRRAGGTLLANEAAIRIETRPSGRIAALTPFALHEGDAVILAAGAWSGEIGGPPPGMPVPIRPVKGEMIALTPPPAAPLPVRLVWGNGVYLVPRGKHLFVGATVSEAGFDTALTDDAKRWLQAQAIGMMPKIASWPITEHWAGLRPGSPDGLPLLGSTSVEGLFVASGQYRNGILFAPAMAGALQSLVLERRAPPEIAAFDPRRFQNDTRVEGPVRVR